MAQIISQSSTLRNFNIYFQQLFSFINADQKKCSQHKMIKWNKKIRVNYSNKRKKKQMSKFSTIEGIYIIHIDGEAINVELKIKIIN